MQSLKGSLTRVRECGCHSKDAKGRWEATGVHLAAAGDYCQATTVLKCFSGRMKNKEKTLLGWVTLEVTK